MSLAGKVAIVTGAANGIGAASARLLAARGAAVVVCDIAEETGQAVVAGIERDGGRAAFVRADGTREDEVAALVARTLELFGRLDLAHNNIGQCLVGPTVTDMTVADWDWTMDLSLKSAWLAMKHEIPAMLEGGGGAIVNTASMAAHRYIPLSPPAYAAAKAGIIQLSRYTAHAYAKQGLRVNSISPGLVATEAARQAMSEEEMVALAATDQLIARGTTPEEVAETVGFLLSDAAAMITGSDFQICGGAL